MGLKKQGLYDPEFEHDSCGVGFICNIGGARSAGIVRNGLQILGRLAHRGATGADPKTGDGAGILIGIPHAFYNRACASLDIRLPARGEYGTGIVFLPDDEEEKKVCKNIFEKILIENNLKLLGWRKVPVDDSQIGEYAKKTEPSIEQPFIIMGNRHDHMKTTSADGLRFERKLYLARKLIENTVRSSKLERKSSFYITNLSSRTVIYKGLLKPSQLEQFYRDLGEPDIDSAICLVHSRYSTNTFPSWELAQPFRRLAHNGEINTIRGNINSMKSMENLLESPLFGDNLKRLMPIITPGGSDSACLDNVLEFLSMSGRTSAHSMMMMIPPAWENNKFMDKKTRDFYSYHACLMEPWDGPAAVAFTDGRYLGAVLDRNGLRPARYIITKSGNIIMASEVGVLDIPPEDILQSGRLTPGKMLLIDMEAGEIIGDQALKKQLTLNNPYGHWLKENMSSIEKSKEVYQAGHSPGTLTLLKAFGYTLEDLRTVLKPMAENAQESVGAMGNDTPPAVLSRKSQLFYNYFKQLFAQVTNPAIDPIREEIVMSLESYLGPKFNILEECSRNCSRIRIDSPVLTDEHIESIAGLDKEGLKAKRICLLFDIKSSNNLIKTLDNICKEILDSICSGFFYFILSDREIGPDQAAIPALLALGYIHRFLMVSGKRAGASLIIESGEVREVNHFALLLAFGADCVNPYMAYEALRYMVKEKDLKTVSPADAIHNYMKAVNKGLMKVLSKMGISTLRSYRGAGIYEALGLSDDIIEKCFPGVSSRIGGIGFDTAADEALSRHRDAFPLRDEFNTALLSIGGVYQWKKDGETHLWNPETIAALQDSARNNDYEKFKVFSKLVNDQAKNPVTLRSLLKFKPGNPIGLEEVESADDIMKRFASGAMSFGSLSKEAHETIAIAMNRICGKSNTGEGGEDPERFNPLPGRGMDSRRSAIKQVASGRFGVTTNYLTNADEIQIKIAQGAKPGEGGQLPGHKVSADIAKTRYTMPGVTLISPPPHHDIYSIEDLAQLIFDLKNTNPEARISVKLVSEAGVGTVAAGVAKGKAGMILVSGGDGGTGASPWSSIRNAGMPWELGISETHQTLVMHNLRKSVRLQTDGQLRTGRDVVIAAILGADEFGFGTAILVSIGCIMLRHCNLNNCSVGIATQDERLRKRFNGRPENITCFLKFVAEETREIMAGLGIRKIEDLTGRTELLDVNRELLTGKTKDLDFTRILYKPEAPAILRGEPENDPAVLDIELIKASGPALKKSEKVKGEFDIRNSDRAVGAMLSGRICKIFGEKGLPDNTINFKFTGAAGQSFGAWLVKGVTFELEGLANDYVGKGLSGGRLIIRPNRKSDYKTEENIIIGNTTFYGAISGEAYIAGITGERFCIRNSGINAVAEGAGDHACEYMTGGRVVILGKTGRNFGAGMSGGIAYIYDPDKHFKDNCNLDMIELAEIGEDDIKIIGRMIRSHVKYTGSAYAKNILDEIVQAGRSFVKVLPLEYKKLLEAGKASQKLDIEGDSDG
jgi:glutamate synthase domain-containing protein 2/glutamate synthase domain-containing protein 1/glutamate synthase domain-containing protein 3